MEFGYDGEATNAMAWKRDAIIAVGGLRLVQ